MRILVSIIVLVLFATAPCRGDSLEFVEILAGAAVALDGDTLRVTRDGKPLKIRLYGIDAPEMSERAGWLARAEVDRLIGLGGRVQCQIKPEPDRYGRAIGQCFAGKSTDIGLALIEAGHAITYRQYLGEGETAARYLAAEARARDRRRGRWGEQ